MRAQVRWLVVGVLVVPGVAHAIGKRQLSELFGAAQRMSLRAAHGKSLHALISDKSQYKTIRVQSNRGGHTEAYVPKAARGIVYFSRNGLGGERWYKVSLSAAKR